LAAANALVASIAPREQSGYAMGLLQMGQGAGIAIGPLLGGAIADQWGYSAAFYVTALLLLVGGVLVLFGIDEHFERPPASTHERGRWLGAWREILASQGVTVTYATSFLNQLGRNMLIPILPLFIPLLMATSAYTNTFTGSVIAVSALTTTLSGLYFGRLGDRVGHRKIVIASMLAGGLLYLPQTLVTAAWQVLILQALLGVAIGGMIPAISALLARYTRPGLEGAVYGLENSIGSSARALAPMLGSSIALALGLRATFVATGVLLILTALFAAIYLPRHPSGGSKTSQSSPGSQPAVVR
jgi:DHA1 family multidrug resistance protein-like MFS transporter